MGGGEKEARHAVCVPYPAQGHVNPMMRLAKALHARGFHVTFVNSVYNHNRLLRAHGPSALDGLPTFRFEAIPDGLPPCDVDADTTQDIVALCEATESLCLAPFRDLINRLNNSAPRVSCIVWDAFMPFAVDVAQELGIPEVLYWPINPCACFGCTLYQPLVHRAIIPFKDANFMTNGDLDRVVDNWIPGIMKGDLRLRDMPSFIRTTDPNDFMLNYVQRIVRNSKRASAMLFNSFDALDKDALEALSPQFPPMYTVGPLKPLLDSLEAEGEDEDGSTRSIRSSLWREDPQCVDWLDKHGPGSVVYVNFGSIAVMSDEQFVEFAWGLAGTKLPFLWVVRPDLVVGDTAVLPAEFWGEVEERALVAGWCNQERVLAHPAVGAFLTHNGWNSTLEGIYNGVPMLCWPFFGDQQTNSRFCCALWGVGMEIDSNVKREQVTAQVTELMAGDKGEEMRRNATKWKELAQQAVAAPDGSSYSNFNQVISQFLTSPPL